MEDLRIKSKIKPKLEALAWWSVKWFLAAAIVVGCAVYGSHIKELLDRHNQLVEALTNFVRTYEAQIK
jgi:hypothetical protein